MNYEVSFDWESVKEWISNPDRDAIFAGIMDEVRVGGENTLKDTEEPISASGDLFNSITSDLSVEGLGSFVVNIYAQMDYSVEALITGRGPGSRPPIEALKRWVRLKGLAAGDQEETARAEEIAKKIAEFGTVKYQKGGPDLLQEAFDIIDSVFISAALEEIAAAMVE